MLLALDIGNTNITLGVARGASVVASRRAATRPALTPDELELLLEGLLGLDRASLADVDAIACASVVPVLTAAVRALAERRGVPLLLADASTVTIPVRVDRPQEVGADRLVNALAAGELHGTPAIVLDFGTATKLDAVSADGAFLGGAIAPGLELGLDALAERTAKLPRIELDLPARVIGRNTVAAIQAGSVVGYLGLVGELLERMRAELSDSEGVPASRIKAVATGGLSATPWARAIRGLTAIDPDLTLRGLALLHARHLGAAPSPAAALPAAPLAAGSSPVEVSR